MIVHAHQQPLTAEEFLDLDHKGFELIDGRMVEKNMGSFSSNSAMWIAILVFSRFKWEDYGEYFDSEGGFQCWPDHPDRVRKPDISFIHKAKLPQGDIPRGWTKSAPDWAVEVLSKNDTLNEVEEKVAEYLEANVRLIWVVDPEQQILRIYTGNLRPRIVSGDEEVDGGDVLPGFRCIARELFRKARSGD